MKKNAYGRGSVPTELAVICSAPKKVAFRFDDMEEGEALNTLTVRPAFVTGATSKSSIETGIAWAKKGRYEIGPDGRGVWVKSKGEPEQTTRPNEPFEGVQIVDLEVRSEGGRAWKVVIWGDCLVDLREDVLLEAMISCGVGKGGQLGGQFVWANLKSQIRLVRYGSGLHDTLVQATELRNTKLLAKRELEPGGIYEAKDDTQSIYFGSVDTLEFMFTGMPAQSHGHGWSRHSDGITPARWTCYKNPAKNKVLTYRLGYENEREKIPITEAWQKDLREDKAGNFHLVDRLAVIEKVGQVDVPVDLLERIALAAVNGLAEPDPEVDETEEIAKKEPLSPWEQERKRLWEANRQFFQVRLQANRAGLIHMVPRGQEVKLHESYAGWENAEDYVHDQHKHYVY